MADYVSEAGCIAAGVVFTVSSLATVILRFTVRFKREHGLALDDWLCIPATVRIEPAKISD